MRACILAVGDELLDGRTVDTNSPFLAGRLLELGIPVVRTMVLGDGLPALVEGLRQAAGLAQLLLVSGGIGPTEDDRTRQAVAELAGLELGEDPGAWDEIRAYFETRGRHAAEANRRQALFPEGARQLRNRVGTAPGFELPLGTGKRIFVLPGVPSEARAMFDRCVRPRLEALRGEESRQQLVQRTLAFSGVSESELGGELAPFLREDAELRVGITASYGLLRVTVRARGTNARDVEARIRDCLEEIKQRGARWYLGEGRGELEDFLVAELVERNLTVALAESCTAGLVTARLGRVPGVSAVLLEGLVSYANASKTRLLGVSEELLEQHGAVSEAAARAMAQGVARASGARLGASVTGVAGPTGGTAAKPVGLVWLATSLDGKLRVLERRYGELARRHVQERASSDLLILMQRTVRAAETP
ncbi:MAG: CinA family nicotinamide mononucleotide deamidase-related protein [Planctomycetota bacterium]